jgi:hypothetical protein
MAADDGRETPRVEATHQLGDAVRRAEAPLGGGGSEGSALGQRQEHPGARDPIRAFTAGASRFVEQIPLFNG